MLGLSDCTCPALGLCVAQVCTAAFQDTCGPEQERRAYCPHKRYQCYKTKRLPCNTPKLRARLLLSGQEPETEAGLLSACGRSRGLRTAWILPGVPPKCCCSTRPLEEDVSQAHNPVLDGLQCSPAGGHVQERLCSSDSCTSPDEFRTVPAATSSRKPSQVSTYPAPQLWGKRGLGGQGSLGRARSRKRKRSALPVRSGRPCWSSGGGAEVRPGSPRRRR